MILKRLAIFFLTVLAGISAGVFLIDYLGRQLSMNKGLVDFLIVVFVGLFIILSLILGRNIPKEKGETEEPKVQSVKKDAKNYAYLVPTTGKSIAGFPISRKLMIIGREVRCDILINDPSVSKKHAQILSLPGGFLLKDLESSNGTFINNQRIQESFIGDGDMVTFGEAKYTFFCTKAIQPQEEGDTPTSELEIDLSELSQTSTATYPATGPKSSTALKSGRNIDDMTFKTPKGFVSREDEEPDTDS